MSAFTFKNPLVAPIANNNGEEVRTLTKQYIDSKAAIDGAIQVMLFGTPHGRDFQISPVGDLEKARTAYMERLQMLYALSKELEEVALEIITKE